MALTQISAQSEFVALAPAPTRVRPGRDGFIATRTRAALRLVPDLSVENAASVENGKFVAILASIFLAGLLALLAINTSLTSGAFTMESIKIKLAQINDQADATLNSVAEQSSPVQLALHASKLGMAPAQSNNFLNLSVPTP
jgi:hypothetical protein